MYHTFGVAVLFWGMLLLALTRRIWRECFLPLSCVYRINKMHCCLPILHQCIAAESMLITCLYWLMLFICTVFVPRCTFLLQYSRLRSLLQMRAYLCCLFPAGTGLKGMRVYRESMQGSKSMIWKGREGMFVAVSGLAQFFRCFSHQSGRKFQISLA